MAIVSPYSIVYAILSGEHMGRPCVIRGEGKGPDVTVVCVDNSDDEFATVMRGMLAELETPGWPSRGDAYKRPCDLEEYLLLKKGSGENWLRTSAMAQPGVLVVGDELATGEIVVEASRSGYNGSNLIRLSRTGWVEPASRLPIALQGNKKYRLPAELRTGNRLATQCLVVAKPHVSEINWVNVCLDRKDCSIEVPSCIPLALA